MSANIFDNGLRLDKYSSEDFFNMLLRYGLFLGAIFQLVCIGASILLPPVCEDPCCDEGHGVTSEGCNNARRLPKVRKQEKKKRR